MEHLNYCRSMVSDLLPWLNVPSLSEDHRSTIRHAIDLARLSEKFALPPSGHLIVDFELRALDDSLDLHLPYPCVALEFSDGWRQVDRNVLFATEHDEEIFVRHMIRCRDDGSWASAPTFSIPRRGAIARIGKLVEIHFSYNKRMAERSNVPLVDSAGVLLSFLNALACSNVHIERSAAKKGAKLKKGALPFDDYLVLTIDTPARSAGGTDGGGSHRSPREHLRRGHIVRPDGRPTYWRNGCVVNAGVGGKITKDYSLRTRAGD